MGVVMATPELYRNHTLTGKDVNGAFQVAIRGSTGNWIVDTGRYAVIGDAIEEARKIVDARLAQWRRAS